MEVYLTTRPTEIVVFFYKYNVEKVPNTFYIIQCKKYKA